MSDETVAAFDDETLSAFGSSTWMTDAGPLDLLGELRDRTGDRHGYSDLLARAVGFEVGEVSVPLPSLDDIVASKEFAGRENQADLALLIERDETGWSPDGCLYVIVGTYRMQPSGTYQETGTEIFVGDPYNDNAFVGSGTFDTTYRFTAKFKDGDFAQEIFGRCQHPIVDGSGTGVSEGASGRLDFKDVISESGVEFPCEATSDDEMKRKGSG